MAQFQLYEPILKQLEGGYQNNPLDTGNYNNAGINVGTNYGISAKVYETFLNKPVTIADMQAMTWQVAAKIHKTQYWDKMKADSFISQSVAELVVDHAINAGVYKASVLLQQVLNQNFNKNLVVDGIVGNLTIQAVNSVNQTLLFQYYANARIQDYESKNRPEFLNSWLKRVSTIASKFGIAIKDFVSTGYNGLFITALILTAITLAYYVKRNPKVN